MTQQSFPTDALLHGAKPSISVNVNGQVTGIEAPGVTIAAGDFKITREPIYDPNDVTRQSPKRPLDAEEVFQIASIKEVGQELIDLLNTLPMSREIAVAITKVEESVMWAVKGVTK